MSSADGNPASTTQPAPGGSGTDAASATETLTIPFVFVPPSQDPFGWPTEAGPGWDAEGCPAVPRGEWRYLVPTPSVSPRFLVGVWEELSDLYADIKLPGGEKGDSGTDLRFPEDTTIPPMGPGGKPTIIDLGVRARCIELGSKWEPAAGCYVGPRWMFVPYQIVPRSSIGKTPLSLANSVGIVDRGYQGTIKVAVRNHSDKPHSVRRGDSLFQLVRPDLAPARVKVVRPTHPAFAALTARGEGGLGSTGAAGAGGAAAQK
jgi:hypothetical protein